LNLGEIFIKLLRVNHLMDEMRTLVTSVMR
jgi:hypothetical protein